MRLIDADALSKDLAKRWNVNDDQDFCNKEVWHALEEAPTIDPDGDTISRSQAIKDVSEWATDILHPDRLVKEDVIHILESLPSAETPTVLEKHQLSEETSTNTSTNKSNTSNNTSTDLISRQDAINAVENTDCGLTTKDWDELTGALKSLPSAEQVTGKLKNPCDSLLTDDSEECKEQKSKLDGDLISRQDAIEAIEQNAYRHTYLDQIIDIVKSLPSAPDSRQRGEWVRADVSLFSNYMCSACGEAAEGQILNCDWNFCPNCGADMRKEESEEDYDYERSVDQMEHDIAYEPTYNPEDGSM